MDVLHAQESTDTKPPQNLMLHRQNHLPHLKARSITVILTSSTPTTTNGISHPISMVVLDHRVSTVLPLFNVPIMIFLIFKYQEVLKNRFVWVEKFLIITLEPAILYFLKRVTIQDMLVFIFNMETLCTPPQVKVLSSLTSMIPTGKNATG